MGHRSSPFDEGRLILAGPVIQPPLAVIGFEADDEAEARAVMGADPCVAAGIVPATLSRFFVGYLRGGSGLNHRRPPDDVASGVS